MYFAFANNLLYCNIDQKRYITPAENVIPLYVGKNAPTVFETFAMHRTVATSRASARHLSYFLKTTRDKNKTFALTLIESV